MKKFLTTTAIALAMVGAGSSAFAAWGEGPGMGPIDPDSTQFQEMRAEMEARHEAMSTAINSGFQAWHDLVSEQFPNAPILGTITSENFSRFQEMHNLRNQSRELNDQAREIGKELGIERGMGMKIGFGQKMGKGKGNVRHF